MLAGDFKSAISVALKESLRMAKVCLNTEKEKTSEFYEEGDVYGFPAVILMLTIIDTIGGFYDFGNGWNHFRILNEELFDCQGLNDSQIKDLYNGYRDPLLHNSLLLRVLRKSDGKNIFEKNGDQITSIDLTGLLTVCGKAVNLLVISDKKVNQKLGEKIKNKFKGLDGRKPSDSPLSGVISNWNKK